MVFENEKVYKILKKIFMYVFPAIMFVFDGLNEIWNFPYGIAISGSLFILWGGFAIFLGVSKSKYTNALQGYLSDGGGENDEIGVG